MTANISLDDRYTLKSGRILISGTQALVRLPLIQLERDRAAGLETAGYITGYRGSPLAGLDQQLASARKFYAGKAIVFQPGVNEDLAATAVWGTQQTGLHGPANYTGVFAMWYGKGPGVDRSGDALRHGNLAGSAALGGVLLLAGDDHTCESSTTCHQSEFAFVDAMIPVLNPAGVQEIIDYGLFGWALSRYSGCWVALKCVKDSVETTATVEIDTQRLTFQTPQDHTIPDKGLSIRWPDTPQDQETRLHQHKLEAVRAYCRANKIDRVMIDSSQAKIGIATTGKSYLDVCQALEALDLDEKRASEKGIRLFKIGLSWPLEPQAALAFAEGLDLILVVEEKRSLIEAQLKELLYGRSQAPRIVGKQDETGRQLFSSTGALDSNQIAAEIAKRIGVSCASAAVVAPEADLLQRSFYFCAGCPHNSSTHIPTESRGYAGIGCSWMAQFMERRTAGYSHMGAEGMSWVGEAPFAKDKHVFQTLGDGTYYHSGLLSIRAAVASRTNITFKILFNDAVAMTGGQPHDGPLNVQAITQQVHAEGVAKVVVVADDPDKYPGQTGFAPGVTIHGRDDLDQVQRGLREVSGTTVLVYDQTCAAEKRRRRKRGQYPIPEKRLFIYDAVCEGCGDCGTASNCTAVVPVETPLGRKRAIDQSSCNSDYSCAKGFCPSFVNVTGGQVRRGQSDPSGIPFPVLPEPELPSLKQPLAIVVAGMGGTGVITVGALIGTAAHLEGKSCGVLDMTGLAQKGGSVWTHIRIGAQRSAIHSARIASGGADVLLGCDLVVAAGAKTRALLSPKASKVAVNTHEVMPGEFTRQPDLIFPAAKMLGGLEATAGARNVFSIDASSIVKSLFGDTATVNVFMLGYAWQQGLLPVGAEALEQAIEMNGVAVKQNKAAFLWGRRTAHDAAAVSRLLATPKPAPQSLDNLVRQRSELLAAYQNAAYGERYRCLVEKIRTIESACTPGKTSLSEAVARNYYKLLAYKDEYEVARMYGSADFKRKLAEQFEGNIRIGFNLAPPLLARRDPTSGIPKKMTFGAWLLPVFRALAYGKVLRGTAFDPFGWAGERRKERALIAEYEALIAMFLQELRPERYELAVQMASLPETIRGFGHVKLANIAKARKNEERLKDKWQSASIQERLAS